MISFIHHLATTLFGLLETEYIRTGGGDVPIAVSHLRNCMIGVNREPIGSFILNG